MKILVGH